MPSTANATNSSDDEHAPEQAELLADDGEDEVGVRVRAGTATWPGPAPRPTPVHPPLPERDQRLRDLVAGVATRRPRVQEREHAGAPVRLRDRDERDHRARRSHRCTARCRSRTPPATSTAPTMSASTTVESRSGSTIDECGDRDEHEPDRLQRAPPVVEVVLAAGEQVGAEHEQRRAWRSRSAGTGARRRRASGASRRPRSRSRGSARASSTRRETTRSGTHQPAPRVVVDAGRDHERRRSPTSDP